MPQLLRRNLRCHYCNVVSRNPQPKGVPRQWQCPSCEAVNYLDERGQITDPPLEATSVPSPSRLRYAHARSPSPSAYHSPESPFCDTCQRNQFLLNSTLAEYIPDEDDPEYASYLASVDSYRAELEERYPQVCDNCIARVQERIRAAGYAAKADNLKRRLVESKKYQSKESTFRQRFTLALIWIAQWLYLASVCASLLWHVMGAMVSPGRYVSSFDWKVCARQAVSSHRVDESCINSPDILRILWWALAADVLTLWWNPKLRQKTNRPGGHMHNLLFVWFIRAITFALRCISHIRLHHVEEDTVQWFHYTHGALFVILLVTTLVAWFSVRITHLSTKSLLQPLDAHLPSVPTPNAQKSRPKTPRSSRPMVSSFDTMAESFTSSFAEEPASAYPPSPTFTVATEYTEDSEWAATPHNASAARKPSLNDMAMDWTPTRRRFGSETPTVIPPAFTTRSSPPQPPPFSPSAAPSPTPPQRQNQLHSIFSDPDPNPFRHKVPAAPPRSLGPARANKPTPWTLRPSPSEQQPLQQNPFFKHPSRSPLFTGNNRGNGKAGESADTEPPDWSIPKNVKREDEIFGKPKFKYDGFALGREMKDTGLEKGFNDLFSK